MLAPSQDAAMLHTSTLISHITKLGFVISWRKFFLTPRQGTQYLDLNLSYFPTMKAHLADLRETALIFY